MNSSSATLRNNPATRTAVFMALVGIGLLSYVVAGWMQPVPEGSAPAAGYGAAASEAVTILPTGGAAAAAMAGGFTLLLAACVVLLQTLPDRAPTSLRDPLTGLYTRLFAQEALSGLVARDDREGRSRLVLVRLEINGIEELRTRYGGDVVASIVGLVGRHVRSQTREGDIPVEPDDLVFSIFLHCEELDQARAFCRRLTTLLRSEQLDWQRDVIKVSASMEITARRLGESIEALEQRAAAAFEPVPSLQDGHIQA